jgi:hypothetical protein
VSEHRVLVCGGRRFSDRRAVRVCLGGLIPKPTHIIEGGSHGADQLAHDWAMANEISCTTYNADWGKHGRAAGPIRNQQMIEEGKPDLVVAFPGGTGTADMVRRAKAAGVPVIEVK